MRDLFRRETAVTAAMYDVGGVAGTRGEVEERVRQYLDNRIFRGWSYSNLDVDVDNLEENDLVFQWQPDGSAIVRVYLDAKVEHVVGPTVYGIELKVAPYPRFERIKYVAEQVIEQAKTAENIPEFEQEVNENYACEGLRIGVSVEDSLLSVSVQDIYGGRGVILG